MTTLYYADEEHQSAGLRPDLDGAFNDGFRGPADSMGSSVKRWVVMVWSVAAWCAGTFVMARAALEHASSVWDHLHQWLG